MGAERLYYTMDQLGSVRELVDSSGVVRADYRYSTYGERTKVGGDLDSDFGFGVRGIVPPRTFRAGFGDLPDL